jgi:hypothetical protein
MTNDLNTSTLVETPDTNTVKKIEPIELQIEVPFSWRGDETRLNVGDVAEIVSITYPHVECVRVKGGLIVVMRIIPPPESEAPAEAEEASE